MSEVDVSIVVCTHNRAAMLREALDSLVRQETDGQFRYEVVVVHTASSDGTLGVIDEISAKAAVLVRAVHQPHQGQVVARNRGIREARGEWIANFDDDQTAEPTWLKELLALAHEKNCRSLGGAMRLRLPKGHERPLSYSCQRTLGASVNWTVPTLYTRKDGPGSGNQLLHRSVYDEVGMYDEAYTLRGYDTDHYRRIREAGIESWFAPRAVAYHIIPESRMTDEYFRETSLHNGWAFARRDQQERGTLSMLATMVARILHAAGFTVPNLIKSHCLRREDGILDGRTRLWKLEGYIRSALYAAAPKLFQQRGFFSRFEFRAERPAAVHQ
jgi:glycosyltransferase involved in cell wall biosynthesis